MLDKKDTTLLKLDCKSKDKVYDMLFGKADACLKKAKTVALLYLGSPYYMTRALEEYNIEEVNIFTTKDFKFIYEPFENAERVKIWYVDNVKDTFKECDMKFDCIIMNPPYGSKKDGTSNYFHYDITNNAIAHLAPTGKLVSLMPNTLVTAITENNSIRRLKESFDKTCISIEHVDSKIFEDTNMKPLAIYYFEANKKNDRIIHICVCDKTDDVKSLFNFNFMHSSNDVKILNKCKVGDFTSHIKVYEGQDIDKFISNNKVKKFKYFVITSRANGGMNARWQSLKLRNYGIVEYSNLKDLLKADRASKMFVGFDTLMQAKNFYNLLVTDYFRYELVKMQNDQNMKGPVYRFIPDIDYSNIDTKEKFYKLFNITPAEQKVIEETMEKYK